MRVAVIGDFSWSFRLWLLGARTEKPSIDRPASSWRGRSIECLPNAEFACLGSRMGLSHTAMGTSC